MKKLYLLQVIKFRLEFLRLPGWLKYDKEDIEKRQKKIENQPRSTNFSLNLILTCNKHIMKNMTFQTVGWRIKFKMGEGCYLNPHFFISLVSSQHTSKRGQICNFDRKKTNSSANSTRLMCYLTLGSKFNSLTSLWNLYFSKWRQVT